MVVCGPAQDVRTTLQWSGCRSSRRPASRTVRSLGSHIGSAIGNDMNGFTGNVASGVRDTHGVADSIPESVIARSTAVLQLGASATHTVTTICESMTCFAVLTVKSTRSWRWSTSTLSSSGRPTLAPFLGSLGRSGTNSRGRYSRSAALSFKGVRWFNV